MRPARSFRPLKSSPTFPRLIATVFISFVSLIPDVASQPPDTTWFGGTFWNADSMRWEALQDSVWTFEGGLDPHECHRPHQLPRGA